jgi:Cytochrome P450
MRLSAELSRLMSSKFPDMEALANFAYTRLVIDEALRLYPPGWLMTRRAIEDDYLGEYYVPAGTEVYISPYVIQRHPDLWLEPESFHPVRFKSTDVREKRSAAMLPFSAGPTNCIGEVFARSEMQVHLITVAKPYPIGICQTGSAGIRSGRTSAEQARLHNVAGNEDSPLTCVMLWMQTAGGRIDGVNRGAAATARASHMRYKERSTSGCH